MKQDTKIIIERRASGSSKWEHYTALQPNGDSFTQDGAIAYCLERQHTYPHFHFRAVRIITTREVLK